MFCQPRYLRIALVLALASATGVANAAKAESSVTIKNKSKWEIHELYFSAADQKEWGPDQLGKNVINTGGGTYTLNHIPCDKYDIKLVDEDGDECVVTHVKLCADNDTWVIKDDDLLSCQAKSD